MKWSLLVLVIFLLSCKKDRSCETCNSGNGFKDAVIIYTGPVATDGCDWVVNIDNKDYHPDNLGNEFKQNEMSVKICYELTADKFNCGFTGAGMPVIKVIAVKK